MNGVHERFLVLLNHVGREEIGVLTSLPLMQKIVADLEEARNNELPTFTAYFTKESHIHTLVNLVLSSGLPIANPRIPELDYAVSSTGSHAFLSDLHSCSSHTSHSSCTSGTTVAESPTRNTPSNLH